MYDICVIGGGPAGMTAALYSLRAGRSTLLMEEKSYGGQMAETGVIENMPGSPDAYGWELTMRFQQQVEAMEVQTCYERAVALEPQEGFTRIQTEQGTYEARKVILAMGVRRRRLGVPGEERLAGKGVGWCAVCDGAFFRNQTVAVAGGGNTALEDALYLSGICEKVYLLVRSHSFRAQELLAQRVREKENIEILWNTQVTEILGEEKVSGLRILQEGEEKDLPVSGLFVAIGLQPDRSLYEGLLETDQNGYISAGEDCRTSVPGIFAAGDVRTKEIRQIVTALGDGAVAAELAGRELQLEG
jgi:thioredoxin reductase (NADPH)